MGEAWDVGVGAALIVIGFIGTIIVCLMILGAILAAIGLLVVFLVNMIDRSRARRGLYEE